MAVLVSFYEGPMWGYFFIMASILLIVPGFYSLCTGAPFVRSDDKRMAAILKLGDFKREDRVCDLGCGDGKLLRAIAREGVEDVCGYEFSIPTFLLAWVWAKFSKLRYVVFYANFWNRDLSGHNKIVCFLMHGAMDRFEKEIWPRLSKGTCVIANEFGMKGVKADKEDARVYLYIKK